MSRRIITSSFESNFPGTRIDTYFDKIIKYIPSDIVGAWVTITGLINSATDVPVNALLWLAFFIGIILTAIWTWKQTKVAGQPVAKTQILVSMGAFVVWVIALGKPFSTLSFYRPLYGSLLLVLYTLLTALIDPSE